MAHTQCEVKADSHKEQMLSSPPRRGSLESPESWGQEVVGGWESGAAGKGMGARLYVDRASDLQDEKFWRIWRCWRHSAVHVPESWAQSHGEVVRSVSATITASLLTCLTKARSRKVKFKLRAVTRGIRHCTVVAGCWEETLATPFQLAGFWLDMGSKWMSRCR